MPAVGTIRQGRSVVSEHIGEVTKARYDQIVAEALAVVEQQTKAQFQIGDWALEIEHIQPHGGHHRHSPDGVPSAGEVLHQFAETIGVPFKTVETYRYVSDRWPKSERRDGVSHVVHKILACREDRFTVIDDPPLNPLTGQRRWSPDTASRAVGWTPRKAQTPQEKVNQVHDLVKDDDVATRVVTDLLHRPDVAFRVMSDDSARHHVNRAQLDRAEQSRSVARERTPSIKTFEHATGVLDLIAASDAFIAGVARAIPLLSGTQPSESDLRTINARLDKVRTAADWAEGQLDHLDSIDAGLAKLLGGD